MRAARVNARFGVFKSFIAIEYGMQAIALTQCQPLHIRANFRNDRQQITGLGILNHQALKVAKWLNLLDKRHMGSLYTPPTGRSKSVQRVRRPGWTLGAYLSNDQSIQGTLVEPEGQSRPKIRLRDPLGNLPPPHQTPQPDRLGGSGCCTRCTSAVVVCFRLSKAFRGQPLAQPIDSVRSAKSLSREAPRPRNEATNADRSESCLWPYEAQ